MKTAISITVVIASLFIFWSQFSLFVIQPIGAVPEGRTLLIKRQDKTKFIDSADGMCEREMNGANLFCRIAAMGAVADDSTIVGRFPYSSVLYSISTGGKNHGCMQRPIPAHNCRRVWLSDFLDIIAF